MGVVGNKIDLYFEEKVKENEGKEYADSIGAKFKLTSAKNTPGEFVRFIEEMLDEYLKKNKNKVVDKIEDRKESIKIKSYPEKKRGGCC